MKKRKSIQNTRRAIRASETINSGWKYSGVFNFGDITFVNGDEVYLQANTTTITFDTSGLSVGDIITISGFAPQKIKHKRKVHVARRRIRSIDPSYRVTDITSNNITVKANSLVSVQKISDTQWTVNGSIS